MISILGPTLNNVEIALNYFSGTKCMELFCDFGDIQLTSEEKYLCCICANNLNKLLQHEYFVYKESWKSDAGRKNRQPVAKPSIDCPWKGTWLFLIFYSYLHIC